MLNRLASAPFFVLTALVLLPALAIANDAPQKKWGAHVDLESKIGNDRSLGELDLFIPLAQDENTLLFTNLRGRADNHESQEGNIGLGIRQMFNGWNLGGYTYFDRRNTKYDNNFNQITVGAEAISETFELRANAYVPFGDRTQRAAGIGVANFGGANISFRPGLEKALQGFDAELGWRLPVFDITAPQQLRVYGGGYHFYTRGVDDVTGPRARAELTFSEVKYLWPGSRFSLNAEFQHDTPRGSQAFVSARLRVPLQKAARNEAKLSYLERRMTAPTVRDIDIVSQTGALGAAQTVTQTADGKTITLLDSSTVTGATLAATIDGTGDNAAVILNGDYTGVNGEVLLRQGQAIYGGTSLRVRLPDGSTSTITTPAATLSGTGGIGGGGPVRMVGMADNTTIQGVTITINNTQATGIYVNEADNVQILSNTINATSTANTATGIILTSNVEATRPVGTKIDGNTLTVQAPAAFFSNGITMAWNENTVISNNSITINSAAPAAQQNLLVINDNTTNISGSGNSGNVSGCRHPGGIITGSVGFTTATGPACP